MHGTECLNKQPSLVLCIKSILPVCSCNSVGEIFPVGRSGVLQHSSGRCFVAWCRNQ